VLRAVQAFEESGHPGFVDQRFVDQRATESQWESRTANEGAVIPFPAPLTVRVFQKKMIRVRTSF
jgi:hypothetical protein